MGPMGPRGLGPIKQKCSYQGQGPGAKAMTQKKRRGSGPGPALFLGHGLGPWPLALVRTFLFYGPKAPGAHRAHILLLKPTTFRAGEQDFFFREKKASPKKPGVFIKKMTYFCDFLLFWPMLT